MNLSDVVRHKQNSEDSGPLELTDPLEKTDFMNMRKVQPAQVSTEKKARTTADYERGIDNLIRGLVDLLPRPGSDWPLDDRAKWFRLAAGIFDLGYKAGDGKDREISIAFVTHGLAKGLAAPKNGQST
jgi:hypothetical protein